MGRYDDYWGYKPYVPVAQRRAQAEREVAKRIKKGQAIAPVRIEGRTIASTFWGKAWCTNLESYSDFANRLPRGRTYVRNGSVVHLKISKGRIEALVSGSEVYEVNIDIAALPKEDWSRLKSQSVGKIGTLVELLKGKLSKAVMELVTEKGHGLFPKPKEIHMRCSCPDGAYMCKHIAAVMYGIGNRFDTAPEMLFELRGVDHLELIEQAIPAAPLGTGSNAPTIANDDLGAIFDIEIGDGAAVQAEAPVSEKPAAKKPRAPKKAAAAKAAPAKPAAKKPGTAKKAVASDDAVTVPTKKAAATKAAATKATPKTAKKPATKRAAKEKAKKPR